MGNKPILLVDFDGVCHSYTSGYQGADIIPDPPVDYLQVALDEYLEYFDVAIYSARTTQPGGREAMIDWFEIHTPRIWHKLQFPTNKPAAFLTLDDRAITFTGTWPTVETL